MAKCESQASVHLSYSPQGTHVELCPCSPSVLKSVLDNGRGSEEGSQSGGLGGMILAALLWMSVEKETQSPD